MSFLAAQAGAQAAPTSPGPANYGDGRPPMPPPLQQPSDFPSAGGTGAAQSQGRDVAAAQNLMAGGGGASSSVSVPHLPPMHPPDAELGLGGYRQQFGDGDVPRLSPRGEDISALAAGPGGLPTASGGSAYRLVVHGIDGTLRAASSISSFVRIHVVDIDTGRWKFKAQGEGRHASFNLDSSGTPYLRMTPKRVEPWQADIGQSAYMRPFATLPCEVCADKNGAMRTQQSWEEGFLITEPMHDNDTMLLFEVLDYIEERAAGDGEGHLAHCVGLAWAFLKVDRALEVSRGRQQCLRLQLHRYRRSDRTSRQGPGSFLGAAAEALEEPDAPDVAGRPAVYREWRGVMSQKVPGGQEVGRVQRARTWVAESLKSLRGLGREPWPAVLEVSLEHVLPKSDLDKVYDLLNVNAQAAGAPMDSAQAAAAASAAMIASPTQTGIGVGVVAGVEAAELGIQEQSLLAQHNMRHRDQPCDVPDDLMWQIASGERGASRLSLSPSGQLLAVAAVRRGGSAEIRIFRLGTGAVHAVCPAAHDALVYDMCWHTFRTAGSARSDMLAGVTGRVPSPQLLISCSGDGVVQLFEVPEEARMVNAQGAHLAAHPVMLKPHATLYLPSHVYSVRPHPVLSHDPAQVVLACGGHGFGLMLCKITRERRADGYDAGSWRAVLPHWQQQIRYEDKIADSQGQRSSDVLCVRFSSQATSLDNLYISDAAGRVMCFQVRFDALDGGRVGGGGLSASFVRLYSVPELAGVPIYSIDVVTTQVMRGKNLSRVRLQTVDDWLLLYSKDHVIRLAALHRGIAAGMRVETELMGHTCGSFPVRGAMSPDGVYVACGSETGELFLWNTTDGKLLPSSIIPQVQLAGAVMDTIWSEHYHVLACCAVDDESPPVLVFIGGDPDNYVIPPPDVPVPYPSYAPELAPTKPPPMLPLDDVARDLRDEFALIPKSIAPPVLEGGNEWAVQWANTNYCPNSAVSFEDKRRLKEKIITQLLDKKSAIEEQRHFGGVHAVPGGIV